jgi:hypothetical protein
VQHKQERHDDPVQRDRRGLSDPFVQPLSLLHCLFHLLLAGTATAAITVTAAATATAATTATTAASGSEHVREPVREYASEPVREHASEPVSEHASVPVSVRMCSFFCHPAAAATATATAAASTPRDV